MTRDPSDERTIDERWMSGRRAPALATALLVGLHLVAFALAYQFPSLNEWLYMQPNLAFSHGQLWRPLTGIFVFRTNVWEVLWLVVFLWAFGREVERPSVLGRRGLVLFYLAAGVFAGLLWGASAVWGASAAPPLGKETPLSTSPAISAVLVLYLLHFPRGRICRLGFPAAPAGLLAATYLVANLTLFTRDPMSLPLPAHMGGALFALIYHQLDVRWVSIIPGQTQIRRRERPHVAAVPPAVEESSQRAETIHGAEIELSDSAFETSVDTILAKITRLGAQSLSNEERRFLEEASLRYRHRRR